MKIRPTTSSYDPKEGYSLRNWWEMTSQLLEAPVLWKSFPTVLLGNYPPQTLCSKAALCLETMTALQRTILSPCPHKTTNHPQPQLKLSTPPLKKDLPPFMCPWHSLSQKPQHSRDSEDVDSE